MSTTTRQPEAAGTASRDAVPAARDAVPGMPDAVSAAPDAASGTPDERSTGRARSTAMTVVTIIAVVGGAVIAMIGFAGSYNTLKELAQSKGMGTFAYVFPVGIDAGIVALLALDLVQVHRLRPWPVLRFVAHGLTLATIWFNASSGPGGIAHDPLRAAMHGAMPVLFVITAEAGRRELIRAAHLRSGMHTPDAVPLHRWVLAPVASARIYRRMRLWDLPSYAGAVERERDLILYREMLDRETKGGWRKAPADRRLPLTMARYGLGVDEALALPGKHEEAQIHRAEAEEQRREDVKLRQEQRHAAAEEERLRRAARLATVQSETQTQTATAEAQARAARTDAELETERREAAARRRAAAEERRAGDEEEAVKSATAAAAEARAAEARKNAAEAERYAAEDAAAAAEARKKEAEAEAHTKAAAADAASADRRAAEDAASAAEARQRVAEAEARTVEAEDFAGLTRRERDARRVARMLLAAADPSSPTLGTAVELAEISEALNVGTTTASERRRDAVDLIGQGYRLDV